MKKYRIIGNMTGNSMDAIDLVLTEFEDGKMKDICSFSKPYTKNMQQNIKSLRALVYHQEKDEIEQMAPFHEIHDLYIKEIAEAVDEMCVQNNIKKETIDAIGFHGKTLDHFPPSMAALQNKTPYTLQMGSGKMLADLTLIDVVYDFRSDFVINGFEGAPLVAPHNARIANLEGDGIYFNGGNTSNFAVIQNKKVLISTDAGPFNEYTDAFVRERFDLPFDKDGIIGQKGKLEKNLLQALFDFGRAFYEAKLPKSGDPAYYFKDEIFQYLEQKNYNDFDVVYTFEYFAAYIAALALSLSPADMNLPSKFILFGGGWKNPVVLSSFKALLEGQGFVLKEHRTLFKSLQNRLTSPLTIQKSQFGDFMEARLMADLAYHKLLNLPWELPETIQKKKKIVCGQIATPFSFSRFYDDKLSRAAKGWDKK